MELEMTIGGKILALFTEKRTELSLTQICDLMPDHEPDSLKGACARLRGTGSKNTKKFIRAKRYIRQVGNGGKPIPVFELGSGPDAPRDAVFVTVSDETILRAQSVRAKQEEMRLQRELDALDTYS